jgi:DNA mismatch endonuclease (patch repair protein)
MFYKHIKLRGKTFRFLGTSAATSANMRAVTAKGNATTEARLRLMLVRAGIRGWKLHTSSLIGKPDFYFPQQRLVLFVDGCFWHSCPRCGHLPRRNRAYWSEKLRRNKERDLLYTRMLRSQGYKVLRLWECQLKKSPQKQLHRIASLLNRLHK